jgi:hypothetical protein
MILNRKNKTHLFDKDYKCYKVNQQDILVNRVQEAIHYE